MKYLNEMTISELEQISGFKRSTIHHYIQTGLLHKPCKAGQTRAYYDSNHLRTLNEIQRIKIDYFKSAKTTRVPLYIIEQRIMEKHTGNVREQPVQGQHQKTGERKNAKRKEELIAAAIRLFPLKGFYNTNVRDIAKEAGITAPTFYHYFNDKRELFVEAIEYVIQKYRQDLRSILKDEKDVTKRYLYMFTAFCNNFPRIGEIINQLRAGVAINDPWAKVNLKKLYSKLTENITEDIRKAIGEGHIREMNPEILAFFLIILDEASIYWAAMNENYSFEDVTLFLLDFLFNGFITPKGKQSEHHSLPEEMLPAHKNSTKDNPASGELPDSKKQIEQLIKNSGLTLTLKY